MSDFTSYFWHYYVAGLTLISILACLGLLWYASRVKVTPTKDNTTGHVWDEDIIEKDNPLPKWWVWMFIITVVFALIYGLLYPMFGKFPGLLNWSSVGQYKAERAANEARVAPKFEAFAQMSVQQLAADPVAMQIGESLFMNNCAVCHAADARGSLTFPNLTDKDWIWGGDPEAIKVSITQGRVAVMPPLAEAVGSPEDVLNVAHYVLSLSGAPHDSVRAAAGKANFATCIACHGAEGKGNYLIGAPNLTDDIWLHGFGVDAVVRSINEGIMNVMPPQNVLLSEQQIHVLTAYVWAKSNPVQN